MDLVLFCVKLWDTEAAARALAPLLHAGTRVLTSGSTALLRAPMGRIIGNTESKAFLRQLIEEGLALAQAGGLQIPSGFLEASLDRMAAMPPSFRALMAEDLERQRPLELAWLSGRMRRLGLERGVATPAHTAAYRGLVLHVEGAVPWPS